MKNVKAAAANSACIGVDQELEEAENKLSKLNDKIKRLTDNKNVCDRRIVIRTT